MFTGIIQTLGSVLSITPTASGSRLTIDPKSWNYSPSHGDSIAVQGVCLTHTSDSPRPLIFDVVPETLSKTSLGRLATGLSVNLESSLTATTPIAGHFVHGHVDGLAAVAAIESSDAQFLLTLTVDDRLIRYIIPTGSVALDGVSLTVARVDPAARRFCVALIPTTLAKTTLAHLKVGDAVNLETDVISRTVVHYLQHFGKTPPASALTLDKLRAAGFAD
jgi:riboflavin synthase